MLAHARALLADNENVIAERGDLREPLQVPRGSYLILTHATADSASAERGPADP